ncbi:MAG: hypothetical protein HRT38_20340, partial [Alteromonadaceae bacterium]|nr:hypothetical protein [Alteromonadaceae bacterium]
MIDTVVLDIPFRLNFVAHSLTKDDRAVGSVDLRVCHEHGCKVAAGEIINWISPGVAEITTLHSCWDSISSSNSSLAFKIFQGSDFYYPFVQIKASANKILQGHNVYGSDDPEIIVSLLQALIIAMPYFAEMLDFTQTMIKQIDCTFTAHVENAHIAQQIIHACKRVHSGQTQCSKNSHETTNYWGKSGKGERTSRNKVLKQYLKWFELQAQVLEVEKKLKKQPSNDYFKRQLVVMKSPEVQDFAKNAVRYEACVMPDMMKRLSVPNHLGDFLDYADQFEGNVIEALWKEAWKDIFNAFGGKDMKVYTDHEVKEKLMVLFKKITRNGNISYTKAFRLHKFYLDLQHYGWDKLQNPNDSKFYRDVIELMKVVPKAQLQNLHGSVSNVTPIIKMINVDFSKQVPFGWVEPECLQVQFNQNVNVFHLNTTV